jgi:hypothetical protein
VTVYVFVGPTLSTGTARSILDAVYLPPVSQGDVYRACTERPRAIGIIDGYFEAVPAVWHKEVLWAMKQGIAVFGSASMGALRAAELEAFGMVGVGAVFEAFRSGEFEDDDEVAVAHEPVESGYTPVSEAMVNIRVTLVEAERAHVIGQDTRSSLEAIAKRLFYADRSYELILRQGAERGLASSDLEALRTWLAKGRRDQKREDAISMLARIRDWLIRGCAPAPARYRFESTTMWVRACDTAQPPRYAGATEKPRGWT